MLVSCCCCSWMCFGHSFQLSLSLLQHSLSLMILFANRSASQNWSYQSRSKKICLPLRISWFWTKNFNPLIVNDIRALLIEGQLLQWHFSRHFQPTLHWMTFAPHGLKGFPSRTFLAHHFQPLLCSRCFLIAPIIAMVWYQLVMPIDLLCVYHWKKWCSNSIWAQLNGLSWSSQNHPCSNLLVVLLSDQWQTSFVSLSAPLCSVVFSPLTTLMSSCKSFTRLRRSCNLILHRLP